MKFIKLFFFIFLFLASAGLACAQVHPISPIDQRIRTFQERYGIPITYKSLAYSSGRITFTPATEQEYGRLNDYLDLFEEEISKYPPEFFRDREVRAIALVTRLFSGENPAEGMYSPDARVMFFDFLRFSDNKSLKRHSIHHELFHMMALQTPGYEMMQDQTWSAVNPDGFIYGRQMESPQTTNPHNPQAPAQLSFVTDYAMQSIEEDKAEVFACLMQGAHKKLLMKWSQLDLAMAKKIQMIKDFVAAYCPEMNEEYWNQ